MNKADLFICVLFGMLVSTAIGWRIGAIISPMPQGMRKRAAEIRAKEMELMRELRRDG